MTDDEIFDLLEAPFGSAELKQRPGDRGRQLFYIDAPTARRRLNDAVGRGGWEVDVIPCEGGVKCALTLRFPSGLELTRADLGGYAKMENPEDAFKSGATDAFKRSCALFGVGAYLSDESHPDHPNNARPASAGHTKERDVWGGGQPGRRIDPTANDRDRQRAEGGPRDGGQPRTGRALFARLKEAETNSPRFRGVLNHVQAYGVELGYPEKMVAWDIDQVKDGLEAATRFCAGVVEAAAH